MEDPEVVMEMESQIRQVNLFFIYFILLKFLYYYQYLTQLISLRRPQYQTQHNVHPDMLFVFFFLIVSPVFPTFPPLLSFKITCPGFNGKKKELVETAISVPSINSLQTLLDSGFSLLHYINTLD